MSYLEMQQKNIDNRHADLSNGDIVQKIHVKATLMFRLGLIVSTMIFGQTLNAAVVLDSDRSTFLLANPGLMHEDFEEAVISSIADAIDNAELPLTSTSTATDVVDGHTTFQPGDIEPGIAFSTSGELRFRVLDGPSLGAPSKMVGTSTGSIDFTMVLDPGVTAIGFDLLELGGTGGDNMNIDVFGTAGLLTTTSVFLPSWSSGVAGLAFVGLTSTDAITSVKVSHAFTGVTLAGVYGIDDVVFSTASPVPIPAAAWLFGTALIGLVGIGKRRKAA